MPFRDASSIAFANEGFANAALAMVAVDTGVEDECMLAPIRRDIDESDQFAIRISADVEQAPGKNGAERPLDMPFPRGCKEAVERHVGYRLRNTKFDALHFAPSFAGP
jgi:hypothetical protein